MICGVNIIGPVFGEFGIGEDVRSLSNAILSLNIPINIIEYPKRGNFAKASYSLKQFCSNEFKYPINIFCMPLFEIFRFISEFGLSDFDENYNVGYSPWELESWPNHFKFMANYLDEIWASSNHTFQAYKKQFNIPVSLIPLIVELPKQAQEPQLVHIPYLDKSKFNFLYVFDSNSTFSRKNPHDVTQSFQKAFSDRSDVGLILKTMNYQFDDKKLNSDLQNYSNITLINDCLSRANLFALYKACDAYISLHKAEGFGRTIAEAMLLKKPVIVSDYSGSRDFCTEETAFLVDGNLGAVDSYAYPFWFHNQWFYPNVESAANQMLLCFEKADLRAIKVQNAYQSICRLFSRKNISKEIKSRLIDLTESLPERVKI